MGTCFLAKNQKKIHTGEKLASSAMVLVKLDGYRWKDAKDPDHLTHNSKCIRDLNVKPDSLNLIEENVEIHMHWGPIRPTINKRVLTRLKNFCTAKNSIILPTWQPTVGKMSLSIIYLTEVVDDSTHRRTDVHRT